MLLCDRRTRQHNKKINVRDRQRQQYDRLRRIYPFFFFLLFLSSENNPRTPLQFSIRFLLHLIWKSENLPNLSSISPLKKPSVKAPTEEAGQSSEGRKGLATERDSYRPIQVDERRPTNPVQLTQLLSVLSLLPNLAWGWLGMEFFAQPPPEVGKKPERRRRSFLRRLASNLSTASSNSTREDGASLTKEHATQVRVERACAR